VVNDQPRKDNVMTDTSKALLAASIRVRVFAKRETIDEALNYAIEVFDRVNSDDKAAVYTALHVVLNTVADKIDALPDSSAAELEPPPVEVRIDHADLPATGAPSLHDQIEDIVSAQISRLGDTIDRKIDRAVDDRLENWFDNNLDRIDERITEVVRNMSFSIDVD